MGKVLSTFDIGWPGAISRSVDDIVVSMKNGGTAAIPFGAPVFQASGENACVPFNSSTSTGTNFVGFAVRVPDKTPDTYGSNEGKFNANDPVDVLVRGSIVLQFTDDVSPGDSVY